MGFGLLLVLLGALGWWWAQRTQPVPTAKLPDSSVAPLPNPTAAGEVPTPAAGTINDATLTNDKIVEMVKAKVPDSLIMARSALP
ncbi:MAG: hypothetical protein WKF37_05930 [Bryobacteraceae bacterium]